MSIISSIGRKHIRVRALLGMIYMLLSLGAVTMIYPFFLLLSGSVRSPVDARDLSPVPGFLFNDIVLYQKYVEALFNESLDAMNVSYGLDLSSFREITPPQQVRRPLVKEWRDFLKKTRPPPYTCACGFIHAPISRTAPSNLREFKRLLSYRYGRKITRVNTSLSTDFFDWNSVYVIPEDYLTRRRMPSNSPFQNIFWKFKMQRPAAELYYFSIDGFYRKLFLQAQYSRDIHNYNLTHKTSYKSYRDIHLSAVYPVAAPAPVRRDWETFVRRTLNLLWIRVDPECTDIYRHFLRARYHTCSALNRLYGTHYHSFTEIPLMTNLTFSGAPLRDWDAFISGWHDPATGTLFIAPARYIHISGPDFMFRDYLKSKYAHIGTLNTALHTRFKTFEDIAPPQRENHYLLFIAHRGKARREFLIRNYLTVLNYILIHGRGIFNTAIYCTLAVLGALLVNPLAAYALSRFRPRSTYKILLLMMLTMAFPPMVTQIPLFLMLRHLHLLNTFAALVLPGLASGFSIFLLKGFFDSIPRELYESAALDGAGEWASFLHITLGLAKPILSVIALQAFTAAYANFMFALLLCQDHKMWTLMVWLYELQQNSSQAVIYASIVVAALPTFIVFVFCQKIIIRGIIIPVEQ